MFLLWWIRVIWVQPFQRHKGVNFTWSIKQSYTIKIITAHCVCACVFEQLILRHPPTFTFRATERIWQSHQCVRKTAMDQVTWWWYSAMPATYTDMFLLTDISTFSVRSAALWSFHITKLWNKIANLVIPITISNSLKTVLYTNVRHFVNDEILKSD